MRDPLGKLVVVLMVVVLVGMANDVVTLSLACAILTVVLVVYLLLDVVTS